ncbi:hypothetical protein ACIQRS_26740 [Streptomyces termitum]|uniref:Uncharacterized protein n=1 Tax=Streptomyces termitum TaxID=67368 RepID=A0A918T628_9ACTN|nr:hypothetical protein [Streptomyces termitum]GHB01474.1 hypothetical protein GCM10010305_50890 [Streptomyces termitum]
MTETTNTFFIPLDQAQVSLVAAVLHRAARDCRAVEAPGISANDRSVVTLGRMAARWAAISEREEHCDVVSLHGDRLYGVSLTPEEWYQVRAALSEYAARLTRAVGNPPSPHENRRQATRALLLVDRITEVITRD